MSSTLRSLPLATRTAALAALAFAGLPLPASAQKAPPSPELMARAAPPASDSALYQDLGGRYGLTQLMDEFMQRLLRDERTRPFFADVDQAEVKLRLVEQFCVVSGGPCTYGGKDMKKAHEGVDINKAQFNALVEVLQQTMDARGIPFRTQNRLLAKLAPMHREVINTD